MIFGESLVFLTTLTLVKLENPAPHCDFSEHVATRQMITVSNPGWPSAYSANLVCRWIFDCPSGYACRLRCRDVGLPKTKSCFLDRILISPVGSLDLKEAHVYCGSRKINARSIGSRIVMGLVSSEGSPGGRFRCKVRPEPWVPPYTDVASTTYDPIVGDVTQKLR